MKIKIIILAILLFAIIAVIFTYPTVAKIDTHIYGPVYGTDYRGAIRHCWWVGYAFKNGFDWRSDHLINYPVGEKYDWPIFSPLWQLYAYPLTILFNEQVAFNGVFLLSFILSAFNMFLLVLYLTKDYRCAFFAGIIYSFCPYHFNKIWEHLGPALIEWLPLYVLCLLRLRKRSRFKDVLLGALAFTLIVFTDYYFAYFMALFTAGFLIFNLFFGWRTKLYACFKMKKDELSKFIKSDAKIILKVFLCLILTFILTLPATFSILKTMFFSSDTEQLVIQGFQRDFHYLFTQAALPLNYILPSSAHPIFGKFIQSMFGSIFYGRGSIEQTLYLGIVPLILAFVAFKHWKKQRVEAMSKFRETEEYFLIGFFLFSSFFALVFSMPPYFNLGLFKIYFPSYLMYNLAPMFRAYARFGILVMLSVAVLASFGLRRIIQSVTKQSTKNLITSFFCLVVLFEFVNIPPLRVTNTTRVPNVYQWLALENDNFVVAEYPFGHAGISGGETYVDLDYLFNQRFHKKRIINGAMPGTESFEIKKEISRLHDASTVRKLRELGIKYAIVHLKEYLEGNDIEAVDTVGEIPDFSSIKGLRLVKKFENEEVYEILDR